MTTGRAGLPGPPGRLHWDDPRVVAPLLMVAGGLVSAWYAPLGLPFQDEGGLLALAARLLRGEVFYRDLDAYTLPGSIYLLAACLRAFGEHLYVARTLAGALFCGTLLAHYAIALAIVDRRSAALFAGSLLGWKFLAWPMGSSYLHGDVAHLFAFAGIACLLHAPGTPRRAARLCAPAGVAIALALLCRQNLGLYVGAAALGVLLAPGLLGRAPPPERGRRALALAAAAAVPLLVAGLWFARQGVLGAMLHSAFARPFTGYLSTSGVPYHPMLAFWELGSLRGTPASSYIPQEIWRALMLQHLPGESLQDVYWLAGEIAARLLYCTVPVALLAVAALRLRRRGAPSDARLLALAALALAVFLAAFPRADVLHVVPTLPPFVLLIYATWRDVAGRLRRARLFETAAVLAFLLSCAAGAWHSASYRTLHLELAKAGVWVAPSDAWVEPVVEATRRAIRPGEPFFVYGHEAQLYYLSDRYSPWPFVWLYPGMTGGDGGRALADVLRRDPPALVVRGTVKLPGLPPLREEAPALADFIAREYEIDREFFARHPGRGPKPHPFLVEVLRRRPEAP